MMTNGVFSWWLLLCALTGLNFLAWSVSRTALSKRSATLAPDVYGTRRWQLVLCAVYAAGCGFRAINPVFDVPRLCLFDSGLSSVLVGRSVATLAELCFAAQWALLLREYARAGGSTFGRAAAALIVPLIAFAEFCSWYSVLTTSNIGHVAEESIWGLCGALAVASLIAVMPHCDGRLRRTMGLWCVAGAAYVGYIYLVDVPMYWSRWVADEMGGRTYLSIAQGLQDVWGHRVISHDWHAWQSEVIWMTLYFSVGVWVSISLTHAPAFTPRAKTASKSGARLSMAG